MKQEKILILGGYGGNNVGDDAQLAGTLEDLRRNFPNVNLVVLTPHLIQTMRRHWPSSVSFAPRVSFFDFDEDAARYVRFEKSENKKFMLERSAFIFLNCQSLARGKPHELSNKQLQLVNEIRTAKLLYYAGGGYFMGPTASRLYDGVLVCKVAELFGTPVVMSGQNIGVWLNDENRSIAGDGFSSVKLIGTRDKYFSKEDLRLAGIEGGHIMHTHDDALYIKSCDKAVVSYILKKRGVANCNAPYITLSFHLTRGIAKIVRRIREYTDLPIVIIPTCPPDQIHQKNVYDALIKDGYNNIHIIEKLHSHSEIKGVISGAYACISTRHHPLIFALGNSVPCLSINTTEYFSKKNIGALDLCDVAGMSFDAIDMIVSAKQEIELSNKIKELIHNNSGLSRIIANSHRNIKSTKTIFLSRVVDVYNES